MEMTIKIFREEDYTLSINNEDKSNSRYWLLLVIIGLILVYIDMREF
ncbi:hypothetical protein [Bacillus thuringiensis]|nr:hypothetical protein [Bacillus thuringiensis]